MKIIEHLLFFIIVDNEEMEKKLLEEACSCYVEPTMTNYKLPVLLRSVLSACRQRNPCMSLF